MIADLKADSERWEAERRATQSRGQPSNGISFRDSDGIVGKSNTPIVEYRASTTHQSRQYYGPTSETAQPATLGYQQPSSTPTEQVYDSAQGGYPQQSSYAQPPSAYQQSQGYAVQEQILALTQEVPVLTLEVPVPGYPLPLSPQSRGVAFSMLLPALPIPNSKIAGRCTLLINNLQSHQLRIPNLKILTTAIVVRTITSHLLGFFFPYENFLTIQRFLLQAPTTPRIHMVNEYTKTALPTVRFQ